MIGQICRDSVFYSTEGVPAEFIRRTYSHVGLAVLAFIAVETLLLQWSGAGRLAYLMLNGLDGYAWLVVLGAFMWVSGLADNWARSEVSSRRQYMGLDLYVVAEAVIFLPLLYLTAHFTSPDVIPTAGIITALLFAGLTFTAFTTRTDFSFLRGILGVGGFVASWSDCGKYPIRVRFGDSLRHNDGCLCGRIDPVSDFERHSPLSPGSTCCRIAGTVRLGSVVILVRAANCHVV